MSVTSDRAKIVRWLPRLVKRRALVAVAKADHTRAQAAIRRARQLGQHPRQNLVDVRDAASDHLATRRAQLAAAERVVARARARIKAAPAESPSNTFPGSPVPGTHALPPDHETAGLPGFPGRDYFAPAGSPCVSPVAGVVTRFSGHDPATGPVDGPHGPFGWSVYIVGNGRTYYLTHMGTRTIALGAKVLQGQVIGTVGNYAKWTGTPNHIHQGVHVN